MCYCISVNALLLRYPRLLPPQPSRGERRRVVLRIKDAAVAVVIAEGNKKEKKNGDTVYGYGRSESPLISDENNAKIVLTPTQSSRSIWCVRRKAGRNFSIIFDVSGGEGFLREKNALRLERTVRARFRQNRSRKNRHRSGRAPRSYRNFFRSISAPNCTIRF